MITVAVVLGELSEVSLSTRYSNCEREQVLLPLFIICLRRYKTLALLRKSKKALISSDQVKRKKDNYESFEEVDA